MTPRFSEASAAVLRLDGDIKRGGRNLWVIAEAGDPSDAGLFSEPGELALGETARSLLDLHDGIGQREAAFEVRAHLGVADKLKGFCAGGYAAGDEAANFVEPSGSEHGVHAFVDFLVEGFARRREADFLDRETLEGVTAAAMNFTDGFPSQHAHFDCADGFLGVARSDTGGGFAVEPRERAMEMSGAAQFRFLAQPLAQFLGARGSVRQALKQRAEIQPRSGREDRNLLAVAQPVEDFDGAAAIVARGEDFSRFHEIHQVMRDAALFADGNLPGANVEAAIDLCGIAGKDFAVETLGERDAQRGFSGG